MTVRELAYDWIENYHKYNIKHQTYIRYLCSINNYIIPFIGNNDINMLSRKDILGFINTLRNYEGTRIKKKLSVSTINNVLVILKLIFNYAVNFEIVLNNPTDRIKSVKREYSRNIKFFSIDEQRKIEEYIYKQDNIYYYGILLDLYLGLRIGELLALEWGDIDFNKGIVKINKTIFISRDEDNKWKEMSNNPKTKTSLREIPIPLFILDILKRFKNNNLKSRVISSLDGEIINIKSYRYYYKKMLKHLNISNLPFHSLRHTFATRAIENNMDVKTLSEILGHSDPAVTLRVYAHSSDDHKRKAMENLHPLFKIDN